MNLIRIRVRGTTSKDIVFSNVSSQIEIAKFDKLIKNLIYSDTVTIEYYRNIISANHIVSYIVNYTTGIISITNLRLISDNSYCNTLPAHTTVYSDLLLII